MWLLAIMLALVLQRAALLKPAPSSGLLRRKLTTPPAPGSLSVASFFTLPEAAQTAIRDLECEVAAPIQVECWRSRADSMCVHAPTGSGKTLAMLLPAMQHLFWSEPESDGALVALVPSRELATQHARLASKLLGDAENVTCVTTSTIGDDEGTRRAAAALASSRCVVATPRELSLVLEAETRLYVTFASRVKALILDELDLLMPASKCESRVTRWQDVGMHPAEALVKLLARRSIEDLRVVAGSATLDKVAKTKLERCLKGARAPALKAQLPLAVVRLGVLDENSAAALTTKTKLATTPTIRTTLIPRSIAHTYVRIDNKADESGIIDSLRRAVRATSARAALVFVCSSSGLKIRAIDSGLRARGLRCLVLGDVLWPSSARNRRRAAHKQIKRGAPDDRNARRAPIEGLAKLADAASADLNSMLRTATPEEPQLVVADQAVTRGLHLDGIDAVFVVGRPSNADTYLHLAGRTARDPLSHERHLDAEDPRRQLQHYHHHAGAATGTVVTLAKEPDIRMLRSWLDKLGVSDLRELALAQSA
ncbi:hypothetical protein CTAYLR_004795 [Chrysophaeum taylorii]|uniref:Helicase ATP-binding domain-containing protein n=1 Tax=Chrysophaeum taylorii TaxID=2483200 RepID=A0AAD7UPG4_9STRA|nr:hypothetical protein CTAYLR_004795 [Chrysophaeum taylorii]